jgi:hypothetical protein
VADAKVKARIEAKDDASRTVAKVEGRFKRFGRFLASRFVITLGDVTRLMRGVASAFKSVTGAAQVQEDAIRKLDAALAKIGSASAAVSKELQEQAAALQQVTKYGDETIINGQALIASFTSNTDEIKKATAAALDLAAATGTNLQSAFLLLGRAAAGETSMLSRYGIALDEAVPQSEKFAAAIEKINEQFGGQAQAQAETYSGVMGQIKNAFGDLLETLGFAITKNEAIVASLKSLRDALTSGRVVEMVGKLATNIGKVAAVTVEAVAAIPDLIAGIKELGRASADAQPRSKALSIAIEQLGSAAKGFSGVFLVQQLIALGKATRAEQAAIEALNAQLEENAKATDKAAVAAERLKRILGEEKTEFKSMQDIAAELGVTLEGDVNAALAANEEKLLKARDAARRGIITWEDYERIVAGVAASNADLKQSLADVATGTDESAAAMERFAAATENVTKAQGDLETQAARTSDVIQVQAASGSGLFPGLSGKVYQHTVSGTFAPSVASTSVVRRVRTLPDGRMEWID